MSLREARRAWLFDKARWWSIPPRVGEARTPGSWTPRHKSVLARGVENVYWLARYLERAENTARLVSVNTNLLLDLPKGLAPGWQPLIDITGSRAMFDARGSRADERDIVQFLIADPDNPGSILSSFKMARENARTLRDVFPTDVWELLNQFF